MPCWAPADEAPILLAACIGASGGGCLGACCRGRGAGLVILLLSRLLGLGWISLLVLGVLACWGR
jgi:hypothetical protein